MRNIMYLQLICSVVLVLTTTTWAADEVDLPSGIKTCDHKLPDYAACLKSALQESWAIMSKGISELGLPVLDPLTIDEWDEKYDIASMLFQMRARNVKIYGIADTKFLDVRPVLRTENQMHVEMDISIPHIFVEGKYIAEGRTGNLKVGGKGYFNMTSIGLKDTWRLEGRIENDRWVLEHVRNLIDAMSIDKFHVYFEDLFHGNKELNAAALSFINQYWQMLYKTVYPLVEKQWDMRLTDLLNKLIFSKLSFSKVFP